MALVTITECQDVLSTDFVTYPADIDSEEDFAEAIINGHLGGIYELPFDDVSLYASVPPLIKWIAAHLVGYKLWDQRVVLEGQADDTAAQRWYNWAMDRLEKLRAGDIVLLDGSNVLITSNGSGSGPRFYPGGVKTKADEEDNTPWFTRAQAGNW